MAVSQTDFTEDLRKIALPVIVMHGGDGQIVPYVQFNPLLSVVLPNGTPEISEWPTTTDAHHAGRCHHSDLLGFIRRQSDWHSVRRLSSVA